MVIFGISAIRLPGPENIKAQWEHFLQVNIADRDSTVDPHQAYPKSWINDKIYTVTMPEDLDPRNSYDPTYGKIVLLDSNLPPSVLGQMGQRATLDILPKWQKAWLSIKIDEVGRVTMLDVNGKLTSVAEAMKSFRHPVHLHTAAQVPLYFRDDSGDIKPVMTGPGWGALNPNEAGFFVNQMKNWLQGLGDNVGMIIESGFGWNGTGSVPHILGNNIDILHIYADPAFGHQDREPMHIETWQDYRTLLQRMSTVRVDHLSVGYTGPKTDLGRYGQLGPQNEEEYKKVYGEKGFWVYAGSSADLQKWLKSDDGQTWKESTIKKVGLNAELADNPLVVEDGCHLVTAPDGSQAYIQDGSGKVEITIPSLQSLIYAVNQGFEIFFDDNRIGAQVEIVGYVIEALRELNDPKKGIQLQEQVKDYILRRIFENAAGTPRYNNVIKALSTAGINLQDGEPLLSILKLDFKGFSDVELTAAARKLNEQYECLGLNDSTNYNSPAIWLRKSTSNAQSDPAAA